MVSCAACGLPTRVPAGDVVAALREVNILTVPAGENTVRFLPPLIISEDEIRLAVANFETVLDKMATQQVQEQDGQ